MKGSKGTMAKQANRIPMEIIARIRTDFPEKFGIPRQSGLVEELRGTVVFEPKYRNPDALRGIEGFSHLWLLWQFSEAIRADWQPTVRPPRLGGNTPMGVFATRSPFRPNPIGLSSVRLLGVEKTEHLGTVLHVGGADLMDGTPIYDIKPYLPYTDCHAEAVGGFAEPLREHSLSVTFPEKLLNIGAHEGRDLFLFALIFLQKLRDDFFLRGLLLEEFKNAHSLLVYIQYRMQLLRIISHRNRNDLSIQFHLFKGILAFHCRYLLLPKKRVDVIIYPIHESRISIFLQSRNKTLSH